jgi:hypothetical protein
VSAQCGSLLLDTGLDYAIIQVPTGIEPRLTAPDSAGMRSTVAEGQSVSITLPGSSGRPLYQFSVGGADAPKSVQWGHLLSDGRPFMNISRYALTQNDYLYDATSGHVGFRPAG